MQFIKSLYLFLSLLASIQSVFCVATKGTGSCPIQQTIRVCLPRCLSDFECISQKRCCRNTCGTMSCADPSPVYTGSESNDKKSDRVMCGNVKCLPGQKCISNGSMKRPRCA